MGGAISPLRKIYLIAAVLGAVLPMWQFAQWFAQGGSPATLVAAWMANPAVAGLSYDLLIAGTVLVIWIAAEVTVRRNFQSLWAIPATFCIGVSCGLPLYLFLRTRPV